MTQYDYLTDRDTVAPEWTSGGVPRCTDDCPSHDGKRCKATGWMPDGICHPAVVTMAALIKSARYPE